jgi:hypothetical protein
LNSDPVNIEDIDANTLKGRVDRAFAYWNRQAEHKERSTKLTATGLAKAVGCTESAVSNWRSGKVGALFAGDVFKAARYLKVRAEWLADGSGPMLQPHTDVENHYPKRPHLWNFDLDSDRTPVAWEWETCDAMPQADFVLVPGITFVMLNNTARVELDLLSPVPMRQERVRRLQISPKALAHIVVDNNDMAPRILAGDTVFVDRNRTEVEDAGVYLVMWSGKRYLRRLYNRPDGALLISSDSDRSQDFTVPADRRQSVSVVGRMVYFEAGDQV